MRLSHIWRMIFELTPFLILITGIISVAAFYYPNLSSAFIFVPYHIKRTNQYYRFVTSGFLHANWPHLLMNMFVLYLYGGVVEQYYAYFYGDKGWFMFLLLYVSSIIAADGSTYYKYQNSPLYSSLGASGAVSAVIFTAILFQPLEKVYYVIPNLLAGAFYLFYSHQSSLREGDHINHEAHFYGAIYGVVFTLVTCPRTGLYFLDQLRTGSLF